MKEKLKNKKKIINLIIIFIISLIIFIPWLKVHYSVDNYTIENYGYQYYSEKWSLLGGRLIMYLILNFANLIRLPVQPFIVISEIISIFISSVNVIILKSIIESERKTKSIKEEIMLTVITYITIFNFMFIDCMQYVECTVMSLSIMCYLIAAKTLVEKKKGYIFQSAFLVLLGVLCYQGTICMFFAFTTLLSIIKNKKDLKKIIIDIIKCGLISFIIILINLAFVSIVGKVIDKKQKRINGLSQIQSNLQYIIKNFTVILSDTCNLFPKNLFALSLISLTIITLLVALKNKYDKSLLINYLILILVSILGTYVFFIMTLSSFYTGRMRVSIGALIGLIFIYWYINDLFENKIAEIIICILLVIYTVVTIYFYEVIMIDQVKINNLEKQDVVEIEKYIENYENDNNIKIEYVIEVNNTKKTEKAFYSGIKTINPSALRHAEIATSVINVYTGRKLQYKGITNIGENTFDEEFHEQGYICKGNTLYIEIYIS